VAAAHQALKVVAGDLLLLEVGVEQLQAPRGDVALQHRGGPPLAVVGPEDLGGVGSRGGAFSDQGVRFRIWLRRALSSRACFKATAAGQASDAHQALNATKPSQSQRQAKASPKRAHLHKGAHAGRAQPLPLQRHAPPLLLRARAAAAPDVALTPPGRRALPGRPTEPPVSVAPVQRQRPHDSQLGGPLPRAIPHVRPPGARQRARLGLVRVRPDRRAGIARAHALAAALAVDDVRALGELPAQPRGVVGGGGLAEDLEEELPQARDAELGEMPGGGWG